MRGDSKLVQLYKRGELVKVHLRQPRGGRSTDPEDYPPELTAYTLRSPNYLRQQCRKLGEALEEEAMPVMAAPAPPGRFARPGSVFARASTNGGNHRGDQNQGGENDNHQ